jgi:hypothetical protein
MSGFVIPASEDARKTWRHYENVNARTSDHRWADPAEAGFSRRIQFFLDVVCHNDLAAHRRENRSIIQSLEPFVQLNSCLQDKRFGPGGPRGDSTSHVTGMASEMILISVERGQVIS